MMLAAMLKPEELAELSDREVNVLSAAIRREVLTNTAIRQELSGSVQELRSALRRK